MQPGVTSLGHALMQLLKQVSPPLGEVQDTWRHAVRMQDQPEHVDRRFEQVWRAISDEQSDGPIPVDHVPPAVDYDSGKRFVAAQYLLQGITHRADLRLVKAVLRIGRRVPAGKQQLVTLAERHVELLGRPKGNLPKVGRDRPVSTKLECRAEISAWIDRSS